jgi:hypothetical protein
MLILLLHIATSYSTQRPAKALGIWLAIYYAYIVCYKWRTWSVRPVLPAFSVAALLLLSLPYLTSIINIHVLRALHRVYSYQYGTFNSDPQSAHSGPSVPLQVWPGCA